jgi:hypothetical protein
MNAKGESTEAAEPLCGAAEGDRDAIPAPGAPAGPAVAGAAGGGR